MSALNVPDTVVCTALIKYTQNATTDVYGNRSSPSSLAQRTSSRVWLSSVGYPVRESTVQYFCIITPVSELYLYDWDDQFRTNCVRVDDCDEKS